MGALVQSGSGPRADPRQPAASSMPLEVLRAMREAGAVKALAQALNLVSTEHPQVRRPGCCCCVVVAGWMHNSHAVLHSISC